jgi:hypothetical protein
MRCSLHREGETRAPSALNPALSRKAERAKSLRLCDEMGLTSPVDVTMSREQDTSGHYRR